jgi:ribosomal protein L32E
MRACHDCSNATDGSWLCLRCKVKRAKAYQRRAKRVKWARIESKWRAMKGKEAA